MEIGPLSSGGEMWRLTVLTGLFLAVSGPALAQSYPKVEISTGYMYLHLNPAAGRMANCRGGYGSIAGNLNNWFGVVANVDGCTLKGSPVGPSPTAFTY